ncbi:MAG: PKD domain-containing protein [Aliifodinibius sp.]|nr:PKD domain-containing protein [Fodinibius sp.]NIV12652.1 PKD domain-containing protein [Fodinibius sp.]NIY26356.1 PKD domain-containing protein [Fodinibius sp.]
MSEYFPGDTIRVQATATNEGESEGVQYLWELLTSSAAKLMHADSSIAFFIPMTSGEFVLSVRTIVNGDSSQPAVLNIIVNARDTTGTPVAFITVSDSVATLGESVTLDGSESHDPENDPLTYKWESLNGGRLSNIDSAMVVFTAEQAGTYIVTLTVSDDVNESPVASVKIRFVAGSPPVIVMAAYDSVLQVNDSVTLDASQSFDPDGHEITFHWRRLNGGMLTSTDQAVTSFKSSQPGDFVILLKVDDQFGLSSTREIRIFVRDSQSPELPTACIVEPDLTTRVSEPVWLDGSCSTDPTGGLLTYQWQAVDGGTVIPIDSVRTRFVVDKAGTYVISLVVNNGRHSSAPALARVEVMPNRPPVAVAGDDQTLRFGSTATLDGTTSFDPEEEELSFKWTALNGGAIEVPSASVTTFSADRPGTYTISLVVNDGLEDSDPDLVNITFTPNQPPVADAGDDDTTFVNQPVTLDGTDSHDPEDDPLTYLWQSLEGGTLTKPEQAITSFEASEAMTYTLSLKVFDGFDWSNPDFLNITVVDTIPPGKTPVADAGPDTTYLLGETETITLDGSGSTDPDGKPLQFYWKSAETNPSNIDPDDVMRPTFPLPIPGRYVFILTVFNGSNYSKPDQVVITIENPDVFVSKTRRLSVNVFRTIAEGLDFAQPGDLILIESGTYNETVDNFKDDIILLGLNPANTIVDGDPSGSTFFLNGVGGVTIRKLTIRDGGRLDPNQIDVAGISCFQSNDITILGNKITENRGDGIRLVSSENIMIEDNDITSNDFNGIRSSSSSYEVRNNRLIENSDPANSSQIGAISIESVGGSASSFTVVIQDNEFTSNFVHHIQVATNSVITIASNTFNSGGTGIFTTSNSGADLTVGDNHFEGTFASVIFCQDNTTLSIENNIFDNMNVSNDNKAIDLINCTGEIFENRISEYPVGILLFSSAMNIFNNTLSNNDIGIKITGDDDCPTIENNTFVGNGTDIDYSMTACPQTGN